MQNILESSATVLHRFFEHFQLLLLQKTKVPFIKWRNLIVYVYIYILIYLCLYIISHGLYTLTLKIPNLFGQSMIKTNKSNI